MALVRWEPFRELAALQNEMGRWMNQLAGGVGAPPGNGQSSTWEEAMLLAPAPQLLQLVGEVEHRLELGRRPVRDPREAAPFERLAHRDHGRGSYSRLT